MTGPMSETGDDATLLSNVDDDGGNIYRLRPFVLRQIGTLGTVEFVCRHRRVLTIPIWLLL